MLTSCQMVLADSSDVVFERLRERTFFERHIVSRRTLLRL